MRVRERRGAAWATLAVAAITGALLVPVTITLDAEPAGADEIETFVDDDTELRAAITNPDANPITLTQDIQMTCPSGTYNYNLSTQPLTINGNGHKIDATGCVKQVMLIAQGDSPVTFQDITITGGDYQLPVAIGGGGIQSNSDVTLLRTTIDNNKVTSTGSGAGPNSSGGGITVGGSKTLTVIESTISNNVAACTACLNASSGGGIFADNVVLRNSTVSGNSVSSPAAGSNGNGGGIVATTSLTMAYSTIGPNTAPTGANIRGLTVTSFASVVSDPVTGANCAGVTMTSQGYNYEEAASGTCGFGAGTGDTTSAVDPGLGALGAGGGPTATRYPLPSSALIEKVPAASCNNGLASGLVPLTDQRAIPRPRGRGCDIGAVERPAGSFNAVDPFRILDTRFGTGVDGYNTPFPAQGSRPVTVLGGGSGVPTSGVEAVLLNVTVTNATQAGWLTLFPSDTSLPTASNLNFSAGQTVPNLVVAKVASTGIDAGKVTINNTGGNPAAGPADVIVDIVGYYEDATVAPPTSKFFGLPTPVRILDTRFNVGLPGAFTPQQQRTLKVSGSVPPAGVPSDASAVVMNVTATGASRDGWLTVYPSGGTPPTASNLNFNAGQTVPNLVTVKLDTTSSPGTAQLRIANTFGSSAAGTVNVIGDVVGYYKDDYTGGSLVPMAPQRILDTRFGTGGVTGPVAPGATITVDPKTATGLPARGQYEAVVVNVTVTGPAQAGWLTVFNADDSSPPTASNLNFLAGQTVPNLVKISVGSADPDAAAKYGKLKIANTFGGAGGSAQIIVDLVGYYTGNGSL